MPLPPTDGKRRDNVFPCRSAARSPSDRGQRIVVAPSRFAGFALYRAIALALAALSAGRAPALLAPSLGLGTSGVARPCRFALGRVHVAPIRGFTLAVHLYRALRALMEPSPFHASTTVSLFCSGEAPVTRHHRGRRPRPHGPARVRPPLRIPTPDECVPHHTRRRFEIAAM